MIKGKEQTVGIIAISLNVILFLLKFGVGMMSHSMSLVADAFNNLTDFISSILVYLGFRLSSRPADEDHPFGHERYETISGLLMAILMLVVGIELLQTAIKSQGATLNSNNHLVLLVVLISLALKGILALVYRNANQKYKSDVFLAGLKDSLFDMLISVSIFISVGVQIIFGISIDRWLSALIAIFIIGSAILMVKDFINSLLGPRPDQSLVNRIVEVVMRSSDIEGYHDLMVHEYGRNIKVATIHVEIDASVSLTQAHKTIDRIEKSVEKEVGVQLIVHLDPIDKSLDDLREYIDRTLKSLNNNYSFHDLQLLDDVVEFDVVVEPTCKETDEIICETIIKSLDLDYQVLVRVDRFEFHISEDSKE